jgi:hypothetical protein
MPERIARLIAELKEWALGKGYEWDKEDREERQGRLSLSG